MVRLLVCDWNRTLFRDRFEESYFIPLCREVFAGALRRRDWRHVASMVDFSLRAYALGMWARLRPSRQTTCMHRVGELLGARFVRGMTRRMLDDYTHRYSRRAVKRLDPRLVNPLRDLCASDGVEFGVLSSGCAEGIRATLIEADCPPDFVAANDFQFDGRQVRSYLLNITENKAEILRDICRRRGVSPEEIMYIGDNTQDAECLRLVGHPVISPLAPDRWRRRLSAIDGIAAPRSEQDVRRCLRSACG